MKGNQVGLLIQGEMQDGNVAGAEEDLWVPSDQTEIEVREEPPCPIPSPGTKDPLDLLPKEELLKGLSPVSVSTREKSPPVVEMRPLQNMKPHPS
jgi:hypothetical protein